MSMKISTRQVGDVTVVDLAGRLTLGEPTSALRQTIRDLLAQGKTKILLNLGEVSYIDSSGIGELVSAFVHASNKGGKLKLLNVDKRIEDLLQVTKLYTVFETFNDEAEAIRSFS